MRNINSQVNRQLNHLMFANEKQRIAEEEGTIDESFNDERLYKSIVEIRQLVLGEFYSKSREIGSFSC